MENDDEPIEAEEALVSERDERLLKYLVVLIARASQQPPSPADKSLRNALKETFLGPAVGATLITVLIGGVAATWISHNIQSSAREREQALVQYTKYLDQEQALISRVYILIGECKAAADRLIGLTGKEWRDRLPGDNQVKGLEQNYNATKAKWDSQELEIAQLMGYYHPKQSEVVTAWGNVAEGVRVYFKCTDDWYREYRPPKTAPNAEKLANACKPQYDELITQLNKLTEKLALSQPHPGDGSQTQR